MSAREDADLADVGLGGPDSAGRRGTRPGRSGAGGRGRRLPGGLRGAGEAGVGEGRDDFDTRRPACSSRRGSCRSASRRRRRRTCVSPRPPAATSTPTTVRPGPPHRHRGSPLGLRQRLVPLRRQGRFDKKTLEITPPPPDATRFPREKQAVEVLRSVGRKTPEGGFVAEPGRGSSRSWRRTTRPRTGRSRLADECVAGLRRLAHRSFRPRLGGEGRRRGGRDEARRGVRARRGNGTDGHGFGRRAGGRLVLDVRARPETPQKVYPERYKTAPQPPDGPRVWVAPLRVPAVGREGPGSARRRSATAARSSTTSSS